MYLSNLLLQSAALCCETVGLVMYLNQSEVCTCVVSSLKKWLSCHVVILIIVSNGWCPVIMLPGCVYKCPTCRVLPSGFPFSTLSSLTSLEETPEEGLSVSVYLPGSCFLPWQSYYHFYNLWNSGNKMFAQATDFWCIRKTKLALLSLLACQLTCSLWNLNRSCKKNICWFVNRHHIVKHLVFFPYEKWMI